MTSKKWNLPPVCQNVRAFTRSFVYFSLDLMRVLILLFAIALGACVAPQPQIVGPYASRLSAADIEEIKTLAVNHLARSHTRAADRPWRWSPGSRSGRKRDCVLMPERSNPYVRCQVWRANVV